MNESLLREFCESRNRWLIITIVTLALGLVIVLPIADDYFDNQENCRALDEELVHAKEAAASLPKFQQRVEALNKQVAELESLAVNDDTVGKYRSRLVDLVRETGCQMRRIDVNEAYRRPWMEEDLPLAEKQPRGKEGRPTPFVLDRRSVLLTVDGSTASIYALLEKLREGSTFMHLRRLKLNAANHVGNKVTMEIELWLFSLLRKTV